MRLHRTIILLLALLGSVHGFNKFLRRHQNQLKNTIMSTSAIHTVRLQHPGTCSGMCSFLSLFLEQKTEVALHGVILFRYVLAWRPGDQSVPADK
jgi:hypothetical protein